MPTDQPGLPPDSRPGAARSDTGRHRHRAAPAAPPQPTGTGSGDVAVTDPMGLPHVGRPPARPAGRPDGRAHENDAYGYDAAENGTGGWDSAAGRTGANRTAASPGTPPAHTGRRSRHPIADEPAPGRDGGAATRTSGSQRVRDGGQLAGRGTGLTAAEVTALATGQAAELVAGHGTRQRAGQVGERSGRREGAGAPAPGHTPAAAPEPVGQGSGDNELPAAPVVGVGHGHGHSPAPPSGRRVRILIAALLVPCALATLVGLVLLWPSGGPPAPPRTLSQQPIQATVTQASASDCSPGSGDGGCLTLLLAMSDGPLPGRDLVQVVPVEPGSPQFAVGDRVVLGYSGADPTDPSSYQVVDFQRQQPLIWLAALFAAAVLVLGRWRGLAALGALALSFAVLLLFVLPAILAGSDPLAVAVIGSGLIMFAVLYLTHGPSARTSVAVLGTLLSLATIGGLGAAFAAAASLTGLDDQTANLIASLGTGVDARGLLLAGVVIGALGVLDDVTVTQTSAVWELRRANPAMGAPALFAAAMRIGRDHVASAVNTLVLAYAGAALPLMLLFSLSGRALGDVLTSQDVATEVVRTLVGSIGLVASVPITTALAAVVASRERVPADTPA